MQTQKDTGEHLGLLHHTANKDINFFFLRAIVRHSHNRHMPPETRPIHHFASILPSCDRQRFHLRNVIL